jgi:hypothetical protein
MAMVNKTRVIAQRFHGLGEFRHRPSMGTITNSANKMTNSQASSLVI